MELDRVVAGGRVLLGDRLVEADVGIREGRIAALAERLDGAERIDARGRLVLPAGIDAHCHVAQESSAGMMSADGYRSASISAAAGGDAVILPFAAQTPGERPMAALDRYAERAEGQSVLDWANPLILSDPTPEALEELPFCFARGVPALKVFLTYAVRLDDRRFLDVLWAAKAAGVLTMVHAENHGLIEWMIARLLDRGLDAPKWHAASRPAIGETEAVRRAIALAEAVDAPLYLVHVATPEGAEAVREARARGVRVWAETCPHYLTLTRDDLDRPGREGAKFVCSPPLRDAETGEALWRHLRVGTFSGVNSDHAPYRFDETGKFFHGPDIPFTKLANGLPGLGARLPILFSEGVAKGRISLARFAALSAGDAARLFGLAPAKGAVAIGADADLALWDPEAEWTLDLASQRDAMDYTPFDGMRLTGRPETVMLRGETVMHRGELRVAPGFGRRLTKGAPDFSDQPGTGAPALHGPQTFGEDLR